MYEPPMFDMNIEKNNMQALIDRQRAEIERLRAELKLFAQTDTKHTARAWADPDHNGNKLRPHIRCIGCGELGCVTYWGPWCFACNVERMDRINGKFDQVARAVVGEDAGGKPE